MIGPPYLAVPRSGTARRRAHGREEESATSALTETLAGGAIFTTTHVD